jgi:hypothetical protein
VAFFVLACYVSLYNALRIHVIAFAWMDGLGGFCYLSCGWFCTFLHHEP